METEHPEKALTVGKLRSALVGVSDKIPIVVRGYEGGHEYGALPQKKLMRYADSEWFEGPWNTPEASFAAGDGPDEFVILIGFGHRRPEDDD